MSEPDPGQAVPRQPWLHELAIAVDGNATLLCAWDGSVGAISSAGGTAETGDRPTKAGAGSTAVARGVEGLFVDDARCLSVLSVRLGDDPLTAVAGRAAGAVAEFVAAARSLGNPGPDPTVEVHQRRVLDGARLALVVAVTSRADVSVTEPLRIQVGGDGIDVAEAKAGHPGHPICPAQATGDGAQWRADRHTTTVSCTPPPDEVTIEPDGTATLTFHLHVAPHSRAEVTVALAAHRRTSSLFDADAGSAAVRWTSELTVTADDPRLARAVSQSVDDLAHLLLRDPEQPADIFAAAGTPWYLTLFGRDSIWAARLALPLGTELAGGTLRALARRQGTTVDAGRAEEPGKIPHELRRTDVPDDSMALALPPVYYGTVDATPLWIVLLHDAWRWGLDPQEVRDLLPALRAALGWLLEHAAPDDDGLLKYVDASGHGLTNQGWKDSADSVRWHDGRIADAPIALVEAQAYAVEAAGCAATVLRALGSGEDDQALADRVEAWGTALKQRVRERFWVGSGAQRRLAIAIDGGGRAVDGVASNMGHVLGTGTLTPTEATDVAAELMAERMLGTYGIVTLSEDNGGYNPIGYHTGSIWTHDSAICAWGLARERQDAAAAEVARRLLDLAEVFDYRVPELCADEGVLGRPAPYPASCRPQAWSCAAMVGLLTTALGLSVDVPGRSITVRPSQPAPFGALTVGGIRVGDARVTISTDREGGVTVVGLPPGFVVRH